MTDRALHAQARQRIAGEMAGHADDRVETQQRQRIGGIVEIDLAGAQGLAQRWGERLYIDLETDAQCRCRADRRDRLVEAELAGPEVLVAECVEAEGLPPLGEEPRRLRGKIGIEPRRGPEPPRVVV